MKRSTVLTIAIPAAVVTTAILFAVLAPIPEKARTQAEVDDAFIAATGGEPDDGVRAPSVRTPRHETVCARYFRASRECMTIARAPKPSFDILDAQRAAFVQMSEDAAEQACVANLAQVRKMIGAICPSVEWE